MRTLSGIGRAALFGLMFAGAAVMFAGAARAAGDNVRPPDPTHIPFTLPANIKWEGNAATGQVHAILFGDPDKPGMYGEILKWPPGTGSRPHFHNQDRFIYVISGTWWVSSSNKHDLATLYPMPAGTFVEDVANTVHWDGSQATDTEPAVIYIVGMGPVTTTQVDEQGKPLAPTGRAGAQSQQQ